MVQHRHNGLLVEPGSPDSLANAILLLLQDDDLRQHCTNHALDTARQFAWDSNVERILQFYASLVPRTISFQAREMY